MYKMLAIASIWFATALIFCLVPTIPPTIVVITFLSTLVAGVSDF